MYAVLINCRYFKHTLIPYDAYNLGLLFPKLFAIEAPNGKIKVHLGLC